jgi:hypothetical protein
MHGVFAQLIAVPHTRLAIPHPSWLLPIVGPFLALAAMWWLVNRTEHIMHFLFPNLAWERSLGWLNIKAERRAKAVIRGIGYLIQFALAGALYAILRLADGFPDLADLRDPGVTADLLIRVPALVVCLGFWLAYLGCYLIPKIRIEREEAALKKFRRQMEAVEMERELREGKSRIHAALPKPRTDSPFVASTPFRPRRRDEPGG